MKSPTQKANAAASRYAFTLLELLMAIAIISVLASLSLMVMYGLTDQANEDATVTTIQKINRLLEQRQEAFDRAFPAVQQTWSTNYRTYLASKIAAAHSLPYGRVVAILNAYSADAPVWDILSRKVAVRFAFPQRMAPPDPANLTADNPPDLLPEGILFPMVGGGTRPGFNDAGNPATGAVSGNGIPDNVEGLLMRPIARQQLIDEGEDPTATGFGSLVSNRVDANWLIHVQHEQNAAASVDTHSTESSELLYFQLFYSGDYGAQIAGTDSFSRSEISDTDGDGLPEFIDAWGNPLRFYRWPTRLIDPSLPIAPFAPAFATLTDPTDLHMVVGIDGTAYTMDGNAVTAPTVTAVGRTVDDIERQTADSLIKGLPRRLDFTASYLNARATQVDDSGLTGDQHVLIPPDPLLRDPDDPAGLIYSLLESGLTVGTSTVSIIGEFNEQNYHTPDTFHAPLIVSAGTDEVLGLFEPSDVANLGNIAMYDVSLAFEEMIDQLSDNLTNRNRRAGGRR